MMRQLLKKTWLAGLLALALTLTACGAAPAPEPQQPAEQEPAQTAEQVSPAEETAEPEEAPPEGEEAQTLPEDGTYTTKEDVALYIHLYGHLPDNFLTKKEAEKLGWSGGSLEPYAPGMCIGGSRFGNYEGLLPEAEGRTYTECDIDTLGAEKRGAKRIVFSNDGLIYYTEDHYKSFELLYGEE
ncbi:ribonuclease domain-containing protein [Dysosmobacter sp. Sow4_B12]|uniref:ribonuclease domain-containing protein n=1 Tax=Dysosmobacter sp. Sow4_B12 TaxID=3438777 RepID=UPI003F91C8B2